MTQQPAIKRIEEVEEELADLVREANEYAEGTTQTPVVNAAKVDQLRNKLTEAREDLVRNALQREFTKQVEEAEPGETIVFDEVRGRVKRVEEDDDE